MTSEYSKLDFANPARAVARDVLVWLGVVLLAPLWLLARIDRRDGWFAGFSECLSLLPGKPGVFLRRSFYRMTLAACATDCHIGFGTTFAHPDAEIHAGVYIGSRCTIGSVIFERDVTVGSNVDLLSGRRQHGFSKSHVPVQQQAGRIERIHIGANSWIGNSSVIMADIGDQSVIGAGSVVVKPIDRDSVAVGNPAAIVRKRAA
jgi:acetyltransferase-like isoleucine patch superfamily enzyme